MIFAPYMYYIDFVGLKLGNNDSYGWHWASLGLDKSRFRLMDDFNRREKGQPIINSMKQLHFHSQIRDPIWTKLRVLKLILHTP